MQNKLFEELRRRVHGKKILLLGVGNRLRGDDAVGSLLVEKLQGRVNVPLIDASDVPENYLGPIEAADADLVLIIDAADFGGQPGDLTLADMEHLKDVAMSTHNASLNLLFLAIPIERRPQALLVGIQPASMEAGRGSSEAVEKTMIELEAVLVDLFGK